MTDSFLDATNVHTKTPFLDALPLELRYKIYGFAAQRHNGPYLILKEYLEKKDQNVGPPPPLVTHPTTGDADEDEVEVEDEDEDEDEDEVDEDIMEEEADEDDESRQHEDDEMVDQGITPIVPAAGTATAVSNSSITAITTAALNMSSSNGDEDEDMEELNEQNQNNHDGDAEDEDEQDEDEEDEDEQDEDEQDEDEQDEDEQDEDEQDEDEQDEDDEESEDEDENVGDDGNAAPAPAPPSPPSIGRHTKYRHILSTIQLSHCPPPIGLLLTCTQLRNEALNDFLNTCSLDINVSHSFQHQSFFLETMDQLVGHPFSPLEQIRKVNLTIAWDSEYLDSKLNASPPELDTTFFFDFHLDERIQKIIELLKASPELRSLTVSWHGSERTPSSEAFMNEKLFTLLSLTDKEWADPQSGAFNKVDVSCTEHFTATGTVHAQGTPIRSLRNDFSALLASGMSFR